MEPWMWWLIGALVVLVIVAVAVLAAQRRKKQEAARHQAKDLRERASGGERYVASAEDKARELQLRAREAEEEAGRLRAQADDATNVAREHRDRVTGEYLRADEIDPDAKR
ncbi:hypothetical protein [Ornithinimicrobium pekingense]|uniref:DUF3552 domain-containing protein n=1 Tax=Ornithinimicrobium pekingense TaxID=384677 RepID=A0ABQ2F2Y3_9MICO|nr:hypothetical protein [Ornithinimicrobium pekingense]GGK56796.1 hypothetical protein GCM10011509_01440 [Ornithinimicrobium pekingense]